MKYLLLLGILVLVWLIWSKRRESRGADSVSSNDDESEKMVSCAYCGVNLPVSEAIPVGGVTYCSEAHRQAAEAREL